MESCPSNEDNIGKIFDLNAQTLIQCLENKNLDIADQRISNLDKKFKEYIKSTSVSKIIDLDRGWSLCDFHELINGGDDLTAKALLENTQYGYMTVCSLFFKYEFLESDRYPGRMPEYSKINNNTVSVMDAYFKGEFTSRTKVDLEGADQRISRECLEILQPLSVKRFIDFINDYPLANQYFLDIQKQIEKLYPNQKNGVEIGFNRGLVNGLEMIYRSYQLAKLESKVDGDLNQFGNLFEKPPNTYLGLPIVNDDQEFQSIRGEIIKLPMLASIIGEGIIDESTSLKKIVNKNIEYYLEKYQYDRLRFLNNFLYGLEEGYQSTFGLFYLISKGEREDLDLYRNLHELNFEPKTHQRIVDFIMGKCYIDNGRYKNFPDVVNSKDVVYLDSEDYFNNSGKVFNLFSILENLLLYRYRYWPANVVDYISNGFCTGVNNAIELFIQLGEEKLIDSINL